MISNRPFENLARDLVKLHPHTVSRAAEVAQELKPRAKRRVLRMAPPVRVYETLTVDPRVMQTALELAGGDKSRIVLHADGSALVLNRPRTTQYLSGNPRAAQ